MLQPDLKAHSLLRNLLQRRQIWLLLFARMKVRRLPFFTIKHGTRWAASGDSVLTKHNEILELIRTWKCGLPNDINERMSLVAETP